jgi:isopropylmalate/homocitrate/citramalate synthase
MDLTAITDMADFMEREIGLEISPRQPFVGRHFNVTRAGIHADGLLKDEEIYNIFNTDKILNRPASVLVSKTSGLAGIAYWINQTYRLTGDEVIDKRDPVVVALKEWIDKEYEDGRQTSLSNMELEEKLEEVSGGRFARL